MKVNKHLRSRVIKNCIALGTILCIFSGCGFLNGLKKQAKEEKDILGYVKGYNSKIKEIEKTLKETGFNPGSIDGIMDKQTRQAIRDFQKKNQIKETGFVNLKTQAKLDSISLELAKKKQQAIQAEEIKNRLRSPIWIKKIQQALKNAGFDPGSINGAMTEKTKKAIAAFQKSKGLTADGKIGVKTWDTLSKYFPKN